MEIDHLSFSSIKAFLNTPQDFVRYKMSKKEPTEAMIIGKAIHCKILEPEKFNSEYVVSKSFDGRTTKGKEDKLAFERENVGKTILQEKDIIKINNMYNVVTKNNLSKSIIDSIHSTEVEVKLVENGFNILGYIDAENDDYVIEFKSTKDSNPKEFQREIANRLYYMQKAMYLTQRPTKKSIIIAFDESNVSVHKLSDEYLEFGLNKFKKAVSDIKICNDLNLWECSHDFNSNNGYYDVEIPAWIK